MGGRDIPWTDEWEYGEPSDPSEDSARAVLLDEAKSLVLGDRNNSYGPPTQDFARSAAMMSALGYTGPDQRELKAHDVALLITCVKMSRLTWQSDKRDSWVDIAGYAACGWECVESEDKG